MLSKWQSDQGPQVLPYSEGLNAGQINARAAKNMVNQTTHLHFHECRQSEHTLGRDPILPQPSKPRSLETIPTPKGVKKISSLLGAWANRTKDARPAQGASPCDSDSTPGSSNGTPSPSSQEDVRLESMVTFQSQCPVPRDLEDDTPTLAYHQNMLKANRGLPIFRQETGYGDPETAPGDVGTYSVDSGSFNKIFNLYEEEFTAMCLGRASSGPPTRKVKVKADAITRNSNIPWGVSPDVSLCETNRREVQSFNFHCESMRGAVLVATSPAERQNLDGHVELGSWLASRPELIYEHAHTKRQLSDKEPLYIVTGCIKSESCALAAFTYQDNSLRNLLRLENTACDGDDQPSFSWTKQCAFSDATFGVSGQPGLKNQTLFVEGYTLDFSSDFRSRMQREAVRSPKTSPVRDAHRHRTLGLSEAGPRANPQPQQEGQGGGQRYGAPNSHQLGWDQGRTFASGSQGRGSNPGQYPAGQSNLGHRLEHHEVIVNFFPSGPISSNGYRHPSSHITKQLLEMTGKDFALCHDDQWQCALDKIDTTEFVQTIIAESKVVTRNGIALLEPAMGLEAQDAQGPDLLRDESDDNGQQMPSLVEDSGYAETIDYIHRPKTVSTPCLRPTYDATRFRDASRSKQLMALHRGTGLPFLPLEVISKILSHLHCRKDKATLGEASKVSRALAHLARLQGVKHIIFHDRRHILEFFALAAEPHTTFPRHPHCNSVVFKNVDTIDEASTPDVCALLRSLHLSHTLGFHVAAGGLPAAVAPICALWADSLRQLSICGGTHSPPAFFQFLASIPRLESLALRNFQFDEAIDRASLQYTFPPSMNQLSLSHCANVWTFFKSQLLQGGGLATVRDIYIQELFFGGEGGVRDMQECFRQLNAVTTITLDPVHEDDRRPNFNCSPFDILHKSWEATFLQMESLMLLRLNCANLPAKFATEYLCMYALQLTQRLVKTVVEVYIPHPIDLSIPGALEAFLGGDSDVELTPDISGRSNLVIRGLPGRLPGGANPSQRVSVCGYPVTFMTTNWEEALGARLDGLL